MATAQTAAPATEVKLEYGRPEHIAFRFLTAKVFDGSFGPRALFTLEGERRMWLDAEDGSEVERQIRELGVSKGETVRVTKVKYPRGGGHCVRVERLAEGFSAPADDTAAQLEKSIAIARSEGPAAFQRNAHVLPAAAPASPEVQTAAAGAVRHGHSQDNPVAARLMSCYMASIDAISEAQAYADRRGLKVTFGPEDVRATAISAYIQFEKAMLEVRR
ncbi:MAG TPA: hypothetical protein VGR63_02505 [Casimicrobiaceae bacterium]|jgi:hypothetical protein|nr:hypothetical protein [Casimicrobiaceae bacterium]